MSISQQKFREIVFQLLYSDDFSQAEEEDITELLMQQLAVTKRILRLAHERKRLLQEKLEEIDRLIAASSIGYEFDRIPRIERNVLRLGIFELLYDEAIPPKVAIAEAIRLSKKFATPEAISFINAILDGIYQNKQSARLEHSKIQA
jgi:transcription antitermination protein NusB